MAGIHWNVAVFSSSFPSSVYTSDFNYLLMYYVGKYRRKVVRGNLTKSFPEKTPAERLQIERKFYRYLSDYMLEDLKLLHMSAEDLCQRMITRIRNNISN